MSDMDEDAMAAAVTAALSEEQETDNSESSTEETKTPEVAEEGQQDDLSVETTESEAEDEGSEETESEEASEDDESDEAEESEDDKPRGKNAQARIRQLASENRELKKQVEQLNSQFYQPQTAEELVENGLSETDARVEAMEQQMKVDKFNAQVAELNTSLESESLQVLQDFPMFNPDSKDYKPELADAARAEYNRVAAIQSDPNTGLALSANALPYNFFKSIADAYEAGSKIGTVRGQKAAEQMLANVDTPTSATPKQTEEDPLVSALKAGFSS